MKLKITSDGTITGTKLIDEDSGNPVMAVQKIVWTLTADEWIPRVSLETLGMAADITCLATVDLFGFVEENDYSEAVYLKSFEKNVRIVNERKGENLVVSTHCKVFDADTNEQIGAIQEITWEATPTGSKAKLKKLFFDNKEW